MDRCLGTRLIEKSLYRASRHLRIENIWGIYMSAFVVDKTHIDAMVRLAQDSVYTTRLGNLDPRIEFDTIGQKLVDANILSGAYRYSTPINGDLPGPIEQYWHEFYTWSVGINRRKPTPVEAIKLVQCYMYQSCEHPEWQNSDIEKFCKELISVYIAKLPGYEDAPWEW
jgi:hypothetical protein